MDAPAGTSSPIPSAEPPRGAASERADRSILSPSAMGACASYPLCSASAGTGDALLRPGTRRSRPSQGAARTMGAAALYASALAADASAADARPPRTFDLEELGLLHPQGDAADIQPKSIVVDYEDGAGGIPHRDKRAGRGPKPAAECAPDACGPLGEQAADGPQGPQGPPARPRRVKSAAAKDVEPDKAAAAADEDEKMSTSATDNEEEEEERCCSMHKLCMCELRRHRSADDCWLVAYGRVYNVTGILHAHPGGPRCLLRKAGGPDCSSDMDFHTKRARRMMDKCFIGKLEPCGEDADAGGQAACSLM